VYGTGRLAKKNHWKFQRLTTGMAGRGVQDLIGGSPFVASLDSLVGWRKI